MSKVEKMFEKMLSVIKNESSDIDTSFRIVSIVLFVIFFVFFGRAVKYGTTAKNRFVFTLVISVLSSMYTSINNILTLRYIARKKM